ncbi:MAG: YbfB/YjiJ family MFS transporter [Paracoccus sp. (in: a-proteobacteria)]|nr:YbfB/YjiJ family MFS transporter [Paracoccus sp. (in: a-proteobacteria)]
MTGYLLFGAGYIAYMTFMIAWLREAGGSPEMQAAFWSVIGLAAMATQWIWGAVLDRLRHGHGFGLLMIVTALGALLPLAWTAPVAILASAAIFRSAFCAVVATTTVFVRRNMARADWPRAIGALTVAFGIGQTLGPLATGILGDRAGGITAGLWLSAGWLVVGALIGVLQRDAAPGKKMNPLPSPH